MTEITIRHDRAAGRLEAYSGDEVTGRIEYFVLESPARALDDSSTPGLTRPCARRAVMNGMRSHHDNEPHHAKHRLDSL